MMKCWIETWKMKRGWPCKEPGEEQFRKKKPEVQKGIGMVMSMECSKNKKLAWVAKAVSEEGSTGWGEFVSVCVFVDLVVCILYTQLSWSFSSVYYTLSLLVCDYSLENF